MSLIEKIVDLVEGSSHQDGQIIDIHAIEDGPLKIRVPTGWRDTDLKKVPSEWLNDMLLVIDKNWSNNLANRGTISCTVDMNSCRLRCTAFRERGGTKRGLVMRKVPYQPIPLDKLGLPVQIMKLVAQMRGLILITGQTGAGKTTSIASLLTHINESCRNHIITIEDPIEYELFDKQSIVTQREVPTDIPSFANGIHDAMRQSPDVIFVSEIRDADTAETVLRASESGHLVLATLHASSAIGAIQKLLSFFPSNEWDGRLSTIANNLLMAVYQTLIPTADGKCFTMAAEYLCNHNQQIANNLLHRDRWPQVVEYAKRSEDRVSRLLNASIMDLLISKTISSSAAIQASNNRIDLRDKMQAAQIPMVDASRERESALAR